MRRFIITGAPGAGKTAILRQLEFEGFSVVEEAATDVIAAEQAAGTDEPWTQPSFIDAVVRLQRERQMRAAQLPDDVQFHDRSAICTAALATYLGHPFSDFLTGELARIKIERIYETQVFFIRSLGFVTRTEARRISLEECRRFEKIHEEIYRNSDFDLIFIEPGSVAERSFAIRAAVCLEPRRPAS